jgi:hypothetical protein
MGNEIGGQTNSAVSDGLAKGKSLFQHQTIPT